MKIIPHQKLNESPRLFNFFSKLDGVLLALLGFIILAAIINFYGISTAGSSQSSSMFWNQAGRTLFGIFLFFCLSFINYKFFHKISYIFYGLNLAILILLLFYGQSFHGAQRWFDLGVFSYQPAQTMQLSLILLMAHIFSNKPSDFTYDFKQMIPLVLLIVLPMGLIISQPDLGTACMLGAQSLTMICFLNITKRVIISFISLIIIVSPIMWIFVLKDYQKTRILTFVSITKDPQGASYNSIQSKIAVGSGQVFGRGWKKGTQAQLDFLPEKHTDFVFSVFSEEHGFIGSLILLSCFFLLILRILKIASMSRDTFGMYICLGCMSFIFWHFFINIGMTIGILPVVGVPLPLFSYGGSHLITTFFILGLVSSVFTRRYLHS